MQGDKIEMDEVGYGSSHREADNSPLLVEPLSIAHDGAHHNFCSTSKLLKANYLVMLCVKQVKYPIGK